MPPLSVSSAGQRNKSPFEGRLRFAFQGFYFRAASKAATEYTAAAAVVTGKEKTAG